ncbi:MAG TPA: peptide deformylase, partial [Candidatus Saccharimonadales bacterium]|nr:peptide deformylase [Candidatus Saccharimonadales bacterium]
MPVKEVLQKGAEVLTTKCKPVVDFSAAQAVVDDLGDTIDYLKTTYGFDRGIGLAAPQIGQSLRITVAENPQRERFIFINPEIVEHSGTKIPTREGCISFFQYRGNVPRYDSVKIKAFDRTGKEYVLDADGDFAML